MPAGKPSRVITILGGQLHSGYKVLLRHIEFIWYILLFLHYIQNIIIYNS